MSLSFKIILSISVLSLTLSGIDCKKNPVAPPPPPSGNDTTSNNFTFQTYTFGGDAGSCTFFDVAIVNDTDAWAVGAVYLDSADGAPDPFPYNAAHWDGNGWTLMKITVQTKYGLVTAPFYGITTFTNNDIWISSGLPIHGDGKNWTQFDLYSMGVLGPNDGYLTKIWGNNSSNTYFVGTAGSIVHYANGTWTKIESGTSLDIQDIYGVSSSAGSQILAVASDFTVNQQDKALLQINPSTNTVSTVGENGLAVSMKSIWFVPNQLYLCGGDGLFHTTNVSQSWTLYPTGSVTNYYTEKITGTDTNDILIAGDFLELVHYNGSRWRNYRDQIPTGDGSFYSAAIKGNLTVAVGQLGQQAIIAVGRR